MVHVLGQALGRDRKFDSWVAAHGVHGPVAAHQYLDELAQPVAVPAPDAIRESLFGRRLAHQVKVPQPLGKRVWFPATRSRRKICDRVLAYVEGPEVPCDQRFEVGDDLRIGVSEARGRASKAALGDEVSQQADLA